VSGASSAGPASGVESVSARWRILAAAALFSTGGAAIKSSAFSAWQVASLRSAVAAVAILVVLRSSRRFWRPRPMLVGAAYAATMILFVLANKLTTSAAAIFLQAAAPLYVLMLSPWLLRERVNRRDIALMAAVGFGIALLFAGTESPLATAPDPMTGNILAAISGVTYALAIIGFRWLGPGAADGTDSVQSAASAGNVIAALVCAPLALPLPRAEFADWAGIAYLGVFQIGLAYILLTGAMTRVPAFEASVLLLIELVLNPIWSWYAHGEKPGATTLFGGAVILTATTAKTWLDSRERRSVVAPPVD